MSGTAREGGFVYAAPAAPPTRLEGHGLVVRRKSWWVQADALRALLCLSRVPPLDAAFHRAFLAHWGYLQRRLLDGRHGGMYAVGLDSVSGWRRLGGARTAPAAFTMKGNAWKDASHDGRAWLYCLTVLGENGPAREATRGDGARSRPSEQEGKDARPARVAAARDLA